MALKTPAILVLTLSMVCLGVREVASAVIPVTTVQQKISATGGCSLQEAIFSANFDNNVAIAGYNGSTPIEVVTQCVPGSGDDIIVLPLGALMLFNRTQSASVRVVCRFAIKRSERKPGGASV